MDAQQTSLDFDARDRNLRARKAELIALIVGLRNRPHAISPGRIEGVIVLLTRLVLLMSEEDDGRVATLRAGKSMIAAGFPREKRYCDKSVQRWSRDANGLGILDVVIRSNHGHHSWNDWFIQLVPLRALVRGSRDHEKPLELCGTDWTRLDTNSTPRGDTNSTPGVDTNSTPLILPPDISTPPLPWDDAAAAVGEVLNLQNAKDEALAECRRHGLSPADVIALVNHYRQHPGAWRSSGVLHHALRNAPPGCAANPSGAFPPKDPKYQARLDDLRRREFERAESQLSRLGKLDLKALVLRVMPAAVSDFEKEGWVIPHRHHARLLAEMRGGDL